MHKNVIKEGIWISKSWWFLWNYINTLGIICFYVPKFSWKCPGTRFMEYLCFDLKLLQYLPNNGLWGRWKHHSLHQCFHVLHLPSQLWYLLWHVQVQYMARVTIIVVLAISDNSEILSLQHSPCLSRVSGVRSECSGFRGNKLIDAKLVVPNMMIFKRPLYELKGHKINPDL